MDTRLEEYKNPVSDSWKLKRFREIVQSDAFSTLNPDAKALYVEIFIRTDNRMLCNSTKNAMLFANADSMDLSDICASGLLHTESRPYDPTSNEVRLLGYGGENDGR